MIDLVREAFRVVHSDELDYPVIRKSQISTDARLGQYQIELNQEESKIRIQGREFDLPTTTDLVILTYSLVQFKQINNRLVTDLADILKNFNRKNKTNYAEVGVRPLPLGPLKEVLFLLTKDELDNSYLQNPLF